MEEQDDKTVPIFPFERGDILIKLNRISSLEKIKELYKSTCKVIDSISTEMSAWTLPRNPREDAHQIHRKKMLGVLQKQKLRQEEQILKLEKEILQDIENSKTE